MASADTAVARPPRAGLRVPLGGAVLARGTATLWISLIVLLPLAAVFTRAIDDGLGHFWEAITDQDAVAAIKLTLISSLIVVVINAVMVTLIATGFSERQSTLDFPAPRRQTRGPQQSRGVQPRDRGQYRISQSETPGRASHQSPVLPDDDFEEESSIIRFLRDR